MRLRLVSLAVPLLWPRNWFSFTLFWIISKRCCFQFEQDLLLVRSSFLRVRHFTPPQKKWVNTLLPIVLFDSADGFFSPPSIFGFLRSRLRRHPWSQTRFPGPGSKFFFQNHKLEPSVFFLNRNPERQRAWASLCSYSADPAKPTTGLRRLPLDSQQISSNRRQLPP